ncbi:hypothetical protein DFQ27_007993 [Actinomortierella ambigua]|uniref:non-specific serine/threonine protein kinase n=1 Tax=Actinomortierella ambigua TaxID=1343610 RepID=A0A9P6PRK1_9FUNG|nr:hypothetical protein DFQ27_007993 [Actinomortierella ambigua]
MAFFKLNKNKTTSTTSSPVHTPRSSMQYTLVSTQTKMNQDQASKKIRKEPLPLSVNWQATLSIGTLIGAGAYGQVFNARWGKRRVAIKKFHVSKADVKQELTIQTEVQLLERLRDRHIIQFYGTTYHDGMLILVMDYADGGSLQGAIKRGTLDWPAKIRIAQEIVRGLDYIHQENVLHRDLKSGNVLLTKAMEAKLCDFGMATVKVTSASRSNGTLKGTFRWMAPELLTSSPKYSTKSDIYALGMVMWEMAANCTIPFKNQADHFVVMSIVRNGEREKLPRFTPPEYRAWVERCWHPVAAKRPEAGDMIVDDDGEAFVAPAEVSSPDSTVSITTSSPKVDSPRRLTIVRQSPPPPQARLIGVTRGQPPQKVNGDGLAARRKREQNDISQLDTLQVGEGELWYLISANWLVHWHRFIAGGNKMIPNSCLVTLAENRVQYA